MDNLEQNTATIRVEVAYALPNKQSLYVLELPEATSALEAVKSSPLLDDYPDAVIDQLGIFSRPVAVNTPLRDGDRVEVYRPLKVDPKERRRQVAADN